MGTSDMEQSHSEVNSRIERYIEEYLYKKECDKKWTRYWVTLHGRCMMFYTHHYESSEKRDAFKGFIELTNGTKVVISKRKKYSFPFFLNTEKTKYYFKCPSPLQRHQWIYAIEASIEGKAPSFLPQNLMPSKSVSSIDDELGNLENYSSEITTDESSQGTIESDNYLSDVDLQNNSAPQEFVSSSRVILVASQPSQHKVTNFLTNEKSEKSESSRIASGSGNGDRSEKESKSNDASSIALSDIEPSDSTRGTRTQSSGNRITLPPDEIRIHQTSSGSENVNETETSHNENKTTDNGIVQTPGYAQCGRFVLTTSATGITTVDLTKRPPIPKQSVGRPTFSKIGTQTRSRMIRSADTQRGRQSLSLLENRPNSQGNGRMSIISSYPQTERGIHLSANSKYSRHLTSSAPDIGAVE